MRVILSSASPRHLALLGLVLSVFSFAVAMDEAKVSSVITNSNKELLYQFFLVYGFVCSLQSL